MRLSISKPYREGETFMKYRIVFAISTLAFSVSSVAFADDVTLTGKRTLDKDSVISATTITFKPDSQIVTNGFKLTITAQKTIALEGTPKITSFEQRNNRPPGDP